MVPSRFQRTSAVLLAVTLTATSSAFDFAGQNDITQSTGTVAPGDETQASTTGSYDSPNQWAHTASSSNNVPTMVPSAPSAVSGSQGWTPPTTDSWTPPSSGSGNQGWTPPTTDASNSWTPPSSGSNQDWTQPTSTDASNAWTPTGSGIGNQGDYSLECSGSGDNTSPTNDYSLECSGSDKTTEGSPTVPTSTAGSSNLTPMTTTAPTTSSGTGDQTWSQPSSTTSSSNTATSAASGEYEASNPITSTGSSSNTVTSTVSSGTGDVVDQDSSQVTQTSSLASSSNTAESSSNTAQSTASSSTQEGSDATQTSTNSTSSGDHATFGTVTSKSGECVIGNPNKYVSAADVDWIWKNRIGPDAPTRDANWNVMDNKNWIMDHIVNNKGTLNYCVRWDSTEKLSKSVASKFQAMLERQYAAWNHWLIGYDCWPYNEIKINIVGFAVKEASLLDWTDDSLGTITVGDLDSDGVPQCDQSCYRFYDNGAGSWSDTSSCKGKPFDISLWPKQGLEGGFGYDWGQEVNLENMLQTIDEEQLTIVSHEIGHGFGLPDFYEEADKPNDKWPNSIMMAGSSGTVTDSDGWMLRRVLEHLKPRYKF
ncbi:hypothetical protein PPTG_08595 [Phytophthora nicotianae INRA-310]|uniref:Neutral zinc metallopeptidase n=1 Tax=Phytophthora nicotianae (strain INRA-310) TaxID=761204 RepID=W2QN52_PHYN3|nr:hypothetical protein PPTG_08595 [Phytophthora nicotianae INRA-310]ETN13914.1 hypothetical protein PPTG_08595 [Phytophthora nicotianae INRA-310]